MDYASLFALFIGNNIYNVKMYYILTKSTIWSELAQQYCTIALKEIFLRYFLKSSFICRHHRFYCVVEDAGIEPRTVTTLALANRCYNHITTRLDLSTIVQLLHCKTCTE